MALRSASSPLARTFSSGLDSVSRQWTESITPWILIPVSFWAAFASSRLRLDGLSISTPWNPTSFKRANFSLGDFPGPIMAYLTAFLSLGLASSARRLPAMSDAAEAERKVRRFMVVASLVLSIRLVADRKQTGG